MNDEKLFAVILHGGQFFCGNFVLIDVMTAL